MACQVVPDILDLLNCNNEPNTRVVGYNSHHQNVTGELYLSYKNLLENYLKSLVFCNPSSTL